MPILWLKFFVCVGFVVAGGYYLSAAADSISEKKGLSKAWVGVVLLASVTSLPELATTIAARTTPDLAVGNIFGSNTINIVIIAMVDFLSRGTPILGVVGIGHILNAGFVILVTGLAVFAIILRQSFGDSLSFFNIGIESFILFAFYVIGMRLLFSYEKTEKIKDSATTRKVSVNLNKEYLIVAVCSVVVIFSGIWLASLGDEIAQVTGLGTTFVGSIFLAFATSLPEIVVSLSAIKLKSFDMCVGNMFGSNFFNITILAVLDFVTLDNVILSSVSFSHILTAALSVIMASIIIIGIIFRAKKHFDVVSYEIWMVTLFYFVGSYFLFKVAT